jgi:hypothetical protein
MKLKTNADRLVKLSVMGEVSNPVFGYSPYRITPDGEAIVLPGVGGITYNIRVGDPAVGWEADHVEPGVSIKNRDKEDFIPTAANRGLNFLACVGNQAIVTSGDGKGKKGTITGKHGGIEHVLVDFEPSVKEKLIVGDKMLIKTFGVGLKLLDFPQVKVMNMDPGFLNALNARAKGKTLNVGVTHVIPSAIMGSGIGAVQCYSGDYDIQLFDESTVKKYGLNSLRFGDIVAITDADHAYGRVYRKGYTSICIVVHSNCVLAGHGPGATTLMTGRKKNLGYFINKKANIAGLLKLRKDLKGI